MYLQIDEGFVSHPKTIAFAAAVGDSNAAAYLIKLWSWAIRHCPEGDLSILNAWAIEELVGYRPLDGRCFAALMECGFIDRDGDRLVIHEWVEHLPPSRVEYGPNWRQVRTSIVTRDGGRCSECGAGDPLDVHHVIPLRAFRGNHTAANHPDNLKALCRPCHAAADAEIRRNERFA